MGARADLRPLLLRVAGLRCGNRMGCFRGLFCSYGFPWRVKVIYAGAEVFQSRLSFG
jgi:hypothetical protein